jgi:prepilin-type N-terminal cleavage/methylation domain-containing protein
MRFVRAKASAGFTLVEMLVALALVLFIMAILSYAFQASLSTFRKLKATGDLAEKLRSATTILRRDLAANHFEGGKRLSDVDFWDNGPPQAGFFRIWQGSRSGSGVNNYEGSDLDGIPSFRSVDHVLHFTVVLSGKQREDYFAAFVPAGSSLLAPHSPDLGPPEARFQDGAGTFNSPWAEVAYFLRRTPDSAGGTPLYNLYRRQWLAVSNNAHISPPVSIREAFDAPTAPHSALYLELSARPDAPRQNAVLYFNNLNDLTMPIRRSGMGLAHLAGLPQSVDPASGRPSYPLMAEDAPTLTQPRFRSADLLLTDVISFDVRVLLAGGRDFVDLFDPSVQMCSGDNPDFPRGGLGPQVFDTWSSRNDGVYDYSAWSPLAHPASYTTIPLYCDVSTGRRIRILAIQITLRIWDVKTEQTRQTTLIQAM